MKYMLSYNFLLYMIISSGAVLSAEIAECTVSQAYCCVVNNKQLGLGTLDTLILASKKFHTFEVIR